MNPAPASGTESGVQIETILLLLGVVLTMAMVAVVVWLVRVMRREDRERKRMDGGGA